MTEMQRSVDLAAYRMQGQVPAQHIEIAEQIIKQLPERWHAVGAHPEFDPDTHAYIGMAFTFIDLFKEKEIGCKVLIDDPKLYADKVDYLAGMMDGVFRTYREKHADD